MRLRRMLAIATVAGASALVPASAAMAAHPEPQTKEDCKNGGFAEYKTSGAANAPQRFANQGQCVSFVARNK